MLRISTNLPRSAGPLAGQGHLLGLLLLVALSGPLTATASSARAAWPAPATGKDMVASAHPLASAVGAELLAQGGNAVDAAVGVSLALSVVEPWGSGLGGGGFAVVKMGAVLTTFDMREMAPSAATADMFLQDGKVIAGESTSTARAAAIPGLVRGLATMHARFGKLPFKDVVAPAVRLARDGFPVSRGLHAAIASRENVFVGDARRIFLPGGKVPAVGQRFVQTELADVLQRIGETRGEDFYTGQTARDLVAGVRALGGIWTGSDLQNYKPVERPPVFGTFRGYDVVSMGPPSSGGLLLVQMLSVLDRLPRTEAASEARLHLLAEVMKRAFAMRAIGLADPDHVPVDHERFIGQPSIARLTAEVQKARKATPSKALSSLVVKRADRPDTSHFAVVTGDGDGVAMTQTINLRFGNGQVAAKTGVMLNNEMDDFAVAVGVPNAFGLVGDVANAVAPGKRPLSSMTPTLLLKDGVVVGAFGSPGGSRIISTTLQVVLAMVDDGFDASEAVSAPRIHHQWYPEHLSLERHAAPAEIRALLKKRGHKLDDGTNFPVMGNAMAIWRRADGLLEGAADPRGEGAALGVEVGR